MDTTLKQRIVGIVVLIGLLGFCLTVLLHNSKSTQPHIAKINTHPALTTTLPSAPVSVVNASSSKPVEITAINNKLQTVTAANAPASLASSSPPVTPAPSISSTSTTQQQASMTVIPAPAPSATVPKAAQTSKISQSQIPEVSQPKSAELTAKISSVPANPISQQTTQPQAKAKAEKLTSLYTAAPAPVHHRKRHSAPAATSSTASVSSVDNQKDLRVQVGTFSIAGNARTLVDKLHSKGFSAEAQKMKTSKGEMTRVIVGKKGLDHTQAEALRQELEKSMHLQGYIISHSK